MDKFSDGPKSRLFKPVTIEGNKSWQKISTTDVSDKMVKTIAEAPRGRVTCWGIPFQIKRKIVFIKESRINVKTKSFKASWLVFQHTSDTADLETDKYGFYSVPFRGEGQLREHVADYFIDYNDGSEASIPIRRRHQIGMFQRRWGENCVEAVGHHKPFPQGAHHEQMAEDWGASQTRLGLFDETKWINWLYAWENPHPEKSIIAFRFEPVSGTIILSAISAGNVSANPLRWQTRRKAVFSLPKKVNFNPSLDKNGELKQIKLDMGQVISATSRLMYPNKEWSKSYNNQLPEVSKRKIIIEYTAHPEARFHLFNGMQIPVSKVEERTSSKRLKLITPASQKVFIRVIDKETKKPVAVKLHVHGAGGEYLAPVDRHRIPNTAWFEDYSVDFIHQGIHNCTYIPGEATIKLPLGKVYIEVSKGFEVKPIRKLVTVSKVTKEITIHLEKVLPWREKGWVTADTHVHFLSTSSALLEGAAEGVNVVNLLASQWGELMTNVGDFDGKTTHGSREAGGDGEYLVRVGTENRQHVLGHISLLGYKGQMITPMTTGGPDEAALGDPIEILLTEWARQCRKKGGLVILPHFPNPRLENAASIVSGDIDGIEMTSWENLYGGINPYSLSDWYRYLNCGYFVPAVGGTDKMTATTAVGTVRTYVKIDSNFAFDYETWKEAVKKGHTFVTYGPLLDFKVDGKVPGSLINMSAKGGTVDISWKVASVTIPMSKVELVVNGEIREGCRVKAKEDERSWSLKIDKSSWIALLVRGHYADKPEIIAAHSSPVMIKVKNSEFFAAADALTILEQIEGALAYLDTIGTRAEDKVYKRMHMVLESSHRSIHNRMHRAGVFHDHTPVTDHKEHH